MVLLILVLLVWYGFVKAAINVGGIVLNALAIEHFILRHPSDTEYVSKHISSPFLFTVDLNF